MFHKLKSQRTLVNSTFDLTLINRNILYLTHEMDKCVSMLRRMELDGKLQKQVDDYLDRGEAHPGEQLETSPQTEFDEQNGEKQ